MSPLIGTKTLIPYHISYANTTTNTTITTMTIITITTYTNNNTSNNNNNKTLHSTPFPANHLKYIIPLESIACSPTTSIPTPSYFRL